MSRDDQSALRQAEKRERRARLEVKLGARQRALPDQRYGVILADPPWRFEPYSRVTGMDRAAENHYPTSALEDIKAFDVRSIAAPDCVLFLWATAPMLPQAIEVMAAWGFVYKTCAVWAKDRIGTGYWFRNKHEILLLGTRGHVPAPAPGTQWPSLIEAPVGRHSEKPARPTFRLCLGSNCTRDMRGWGGTVGARSRETSSQRSSPPHPLHRQHWLHEEGRMIVKCPICNADPIGRWVSPAQTSTSIHTNRAIRNTVASPICRSDGGGKLKRGRRAGGTQKAMSSRTDAASSGRRSRRSAPTVTSSNSHSSTI
jgi:N6-adenosine-specific RNA methylase IME4